MKDLLSFERFERIIKIIQEFDAQQERISDFFEKELAENSRCIFTHGNSVVETLINVLADEYDCWYGTPQTSLEFKEGQFLQVPSKNKDKQWWEAQGVYNASNDIVWWLYECHDGKKIIEINGVTYDLTNLKDFHSYLVAQLKNESH